MKNEVKNHSKVCVHVFLFNQYPRILFSKNVTELFFLIGCTRASYFQNKWLKIKYVVVRENFNPGYVRIMLLKSS